MCLGVGCLTHLKFVKSCTGPYSTHMMCMEAVYDLYTPMGIVNAYTKVNKIIELSPRSRPGQNKFSSHQHGNSLYGSVMWLGYEVLGSLNTKVFLSIFCSVNLKWGWWDRSQEYVQYYTLTHWGRDKMDAMSPTFWNAFSWMTMYKFRLRFHWSLFRRVQIKIFQYWFR